MRSACSASVLVWFALAGCGGGGGSASGGGGPAGHASGAAVKGPVADAVVTVLALRETGALGEVLASGTTDSTGAFDLEVPGYLGWAVVRITGGSFVDEASGAAATIPDDAPLLGFVDVQVPSASARAGSGPFVITPITTLSVALLPILAHDPEATINDSVTNALRSTERLFGLTDIEHLRPADLTLPIVPPISSSSADYGAVVSGLSWLAMERSLATTVLIDGLARDARDARLDGADFGEEILVMAEPLGPVAGTSALSGAIVNFLASSRNQSGLTDADTQVDETLGTSTGSFPKPIQIRGLRNGYGDTEGDVEARLKATVFPASPQVLIDTQILQVTSQTAQELGFTIPTGLALGLHDLEVRDPDSGLVTRLRDAVEVFDSSAAPTLSAVAPPAGPLPGGTLLRLSGTNFGPTTIVEVDGVPVPCLARDFPRSMTVVTPAHAAGPVDVTVRNGPQAVTLSAAFEYRAEDVRLNPSLPSPRSSFAFSAFRLYADASDGLTAKTLHGVTTFPLVDTGTFTLTEESATEAAPAIATRARSGSSFQAVESLGKSFLLFDSANSLSDFFRGSTNEENGVSLGATAFGPACFFPVPAGAVRLDTVAGAYWVNGIEADLASRQVRQKTGWLEIDAASHGSANFLSHGRAFDGSSFDLGAETWNFDLSLTDDGSFQGFRPIDDATQPFEGRFSEGADLGYFVQRGLDGSLGYYFLTPIGRGLEASGLGDWTGGTLRQEIVPDGGGGEESAFTSGFSRLQLADTSTGLSRLAFGRESRHSESDPDGGFEETMDVDELDVSPSGRVFCGDDLAGYLSPISRILLATGAFPNECLLDAGTDRPLAIGAAVFRDARKTVFSLDVPCKQIAIEAKFLEVGATHQQELGTDLFDLTPDPDAHASVGGIELVRTGTIPVLGGLLTGTHKKTVRDGTGTVTTTRGDPPPWNATVGYTFVDDTLDLFVTDITQAGGRFDGASLPRWIASGVLGNDGEVAALRSNDEFLGDGLILLTANLGASLSEPNYAMTALGLDFDPFSGGFSRVTASRTALVFGGNGTVTTSVATRTKLEDGSFLTGATAGLGLNTTPSGQEMRLNIPNGGAPDREWQTFWNPDGDFFAGIDDTPGVDGAGIVLGVRPDATGFFNDLDHWFVSVEFDPQASRTTTQQLILTPRNGLLLTGEIFTSSRGTKRTLLPSQSFVTTSPLDLGNGQARLSFLGVPVVQRYFFDSHDRAVGQDELNLLLTPRIVWSSAD